MECKYIHIVGKIFVYWDHEFVCFLFISCGVASLRRWYCRENEEKKFLGDCWKSAYYYWSLFEVNNQKFFGILLNIVYSTFGGWGENCNILYIIELFYLNILGSIFCSFIIIHYKFLVLFNTTFMCILMVYC